MGLDEETLKSINLKLRRNKELTPFVRAELRRENTELREILGLKDSEEIEDLKRQHRELVEVKVIHDRNEDSERELKVQLEGIDSFLDTSQAALLDEVAKTLRDMRNLTEKPYMRSGATHIDVAFQILMLRHLSFFRRISRKALSANLKKRNMKIPIPIAPPRVDSSKGPKPIK